MLAGPCRGLAGVLLAGASPALAAAGLPAGAVPALAAAGLPAWAAADGGSGAGGLRCAGPAFSSTSSEAAGGPGVSPITKKLWQQRGQWDERLAAGARDAGPRLAKPTQRATVTYEFAADAVLREHYRNPWGRVRIGRILEDLDSLAGLVAYEHSDDGDPATRPPLLVTATVEAIQFASSHLCLEQDMQMSGRVVWTGSSSMDIGMELQQGGQVHLTALFTFVARDALTGKPTAVNSVAPESEADRQLFERRLRINQQRKAARQQQAGGGGLHNVSPEAQAWAAELLAEAKTKRDLPALAGADLLLMDDTSLENTFTCQPQQRNMHGRIFGGFLMRRAFELAHATTYLFAGSKPRTAEVDAITFRRPVNVGDLITFKSWVTRSWVLPDKPGQAMVHVKVQASVTQPERLTSEVTNTLAFLFKVELRRDAAGHVIPPKHVVPSTEQQALEVTALFGPGGTKLPGGSG